LVIEHIRAGRLRVLAVTTPTRFESLPDIPTVSEFVPDYAASQWFAIGLRKNTPTEIKRSRCAILFVEAREASALKRRDLISHLTITFFQTVAHSSYRSTFRTKTASEQSNPNSEKSARNLCEVMKRNAGFMAKSL
jgi:hypothetical protein